MVWSFKTGSTVIPHNEKKIKVYIRKSKMSYFQDLAYVYTASTVKPVLKTT